MKVEKARTNKYHKNEKVVYIEANDCLYDVGDEYVKESEVNVVELKPVPPYVCKLMKSSNGKNHVEPSKNDKLVAKNYTFDITNCDKIIDLLVTNGHIIIP